MAVKTIEMVRKIRDRHYEETKGLSLSEQIKFIKEKSKRLQKEINQDERSTADDIGTSAHS